MTLEIEPQRKYEGEWMPVSEYERLTAQADDPKVILNSGDYDSIRSFLATYHDDPLGEVYDDLKKVTLIEGLEQVIDDLAYE